MPRHQREPGTLPRPLALLGAFLLTAGTAVVVRMLPAGAAPPTARPPAARPPATPTRLSVPVRVGASRSRFVRFVDTAREPGAGLAAESRRTGVRRYALGHLVAGGDGCAPTWSGPFDPDEIRRLRAMGGDMAPVFGGPAGRDLAATCTRPGGLAAAYRRVVESFDAAAVHFEVRDSADGAAVLRRARAIHAVQRERRLRVGFTLPLRREGLSTEDVAMLRTTRQAGADVTTVNLLAPVGPSSTRDARLSRLAMAVRSASEQIARAEGLADPGQAWRRIALTPVLAGEDDLTELDARKLAAYATRHGLAWLSLRGATPRPDVLRILWRTPTSR